MLIRKSDPRSSWKFSRFAKPTATNCSKKCNYGIIIVVCRCYYCYVLIIHKSISPWYKGSRWAYSYTFNITYWKILILRTVAKCTWRIIIEHRFVQSVEALGHEKPSSSVASEFLRFSYVRTISKNTLPFRCPKET